MTDTDRNERISKIFRMASNAQPIPESGHFTEDDEFLTRWSLGILSQDEHRQMIEHLADCPQCRSELAALIEEGIVTPPETANETILEDDSEDSSQTSAPTSVPMSSSQVSPPSTRHASVWKTWTTLAAAASILIAVFSIVRWTGSTTLLDDANRELAQGNTSAAFLLLERYLDETDRLDTPSRTRAKQLYQRAADELAPIALADGKFERVLDIESRVANRVGTMPKLLNLKLQAERGEACEHALAQAGALTDYGYQLDGETYTMSLPTFDKTTERLKQEFAAAVAEYPDNVSLRLNYGQLLLDQGQKDSAREQFAYVLSREKDNLLAHLGMGLVEFRNEEYGSSLKQFERVVALDPENLAGQLNLAICLTKLGHLDKARDHWCQAQQLAKDPTLRKQIERQLSQDPQ